MTGWCDTITVPKVIIITERPIVFSSFAKTNNLLKNDITFLKKINLCLHFTEISH